MRYFCNTKFIAFLLGTLIFLIPCQVKAQSFILGCLFEVLDSFTEEDLTRTIYIQSEPHTLMEANLRQMTHYAYHVGQIVCLAKYQSGSEWKSEWTPTYRTVTEGDLEIKPERETCKRFAYFC